MIKKGTWLVVLDTKNVRIFDVRGIGFIFQCTKDLIIGCIFHSPDNKYMTNYMYTDVRLAEPHEIPGYKPENNTYLIY